MALAASLAPSLQRKSAGGLPGAMSAAGLDPSGPLLQLALFLVLPLLAALAFRRAPLTLGSCIALAIAPFLALRGAKPAHLLLLGAIAILLMLRPVVRSRRQLIWLPVLLFAYFFALNWLKPMSAFVLVLSGGAAALGGTPPPRRWRLHFLFPLIVVAYPLLLLGVTGPRTVDFFEDGHFLTPAAEMRRGETPYEDIVPVHGLLSDGGFDAIAGGDDAGEILRRRRIVEAINLAAIYAVALAATGAPEIALLATFLSIFMFPSHTVWFRSSAGLFALALVAAAVRLRSRKHLIAAGAMCATAFLFGMEFAVYSGFVALVAALRWPPRTRALAALFLGVAIAAVPLLIAFAIFGFADDFLRVTFAELLPAGALYIPGPLTMPAISAAMIGWLLAAIGAAAMLARNPLRMRRGDAVWMVALWIAVAAVSYAQRRHLYFLFALVPFAVAAIWSWRRHRVAAAIAAIALIAAAKPLTHLFDVVPLLHARPTAGEPVAELRRARGALFHPDVAGGLRKLNAIVQPGETFFDFSNSASLYYFFERDCPVRHHQVPFYETERAQREVLARIAGVRYVVTSFPGGDSKIDGVPNRVRAPLVWQWIEQNFAPLVQDGGFEVWVRRSGG